MRGGGCDQNSTALISNAPAAIELQMWLLESPISDVTFVAAAVVGVPTYCLDPWLKPGTGSKNETWLLCSSCFLVSHQRLPLIDG